MSQRLGKRQLTLHLVIRAALDLSGGRRIVRVVKAADTALKRVGIAAPRIAVSGVNPHAGEGGLFGDEEIETVTPAIEAARADGINAEGPFGADTMYLDESYDAYVVMYHDQGHIPAKLLGFTGTAAFARSTPGLFSSVAHGSALDIAGRGKADPGALIWTLKQISGAALSP